MHKLDQNIGTTENRPADLSNVVDRDDHTRQPPRPPYQFLPPRASPDILQSVRNQLETTILWQDIKTMGTHYQQNPT